MYVLATSKLQSINKVLDKCILSGEAITPALNIQADYEFKGQLLLIPINSKGKSNNTLYNLKTSLAMTCEKFQKKGKEFIRITDYKLNFDPERVNFFYDNVFDGDKSISEEIQKVLNENSKLIFDDSKSDWEISYGLVFKDIANRIFTRVPIKDIFLD